MKRADEETFTGIVTGGALLAFLILAAATFGGCNQVGDAVEPPPSLSSPGDVMLTFNAPVEKAAEVLIDRTVRIFPGHTCDEALSGITMMLIGQQTHPTIAQAVKDGESKQTSCTQALINIAVANKALNDAAKKAEDDKMAAEQAKKDEEALKAQEKSE